MYIEFRRAARLLRIITGCLSLVTFIIMAGHEAYSQNSEQMKHFASGGGAPNDQAEAEIDVSAENLGNFGDLVTDLPHTEIIAIRNNGISELSYQVSVAISTHSFVFDTNPEGADRLNSPLRHLSSYVLGQFIGQGAAQAAEVILATDFESGLDGFTAVGPLADDWQLTSAGKAGIPGHSSPTVAYFGRVFDDDSLHYRDGANAVLLSPVLDLSDVAQEDLLALTFNYFQVAEPGYDFSSVVITTDGGQTFTEVATSDNGVLAQVTEQWQAVMISLYNLAGETSVQVGFRFTSDELVTAEGWYIDDVQLATLPGQNPIYASPRTGRVAPAGDTANVAITVNPAPLQRAFYKGEFAVASNDPANPSLHFSFDFKVDSPQHPTLAPVEPVLNLEIVKGEPARVATSVANSGNSPLTFLRLIGPSKVAFANTALNLFTDAPRLRQAWTKPSDELRLADIPIRPASDNGQDTRIARVEQDEFLFSTTLPDAKRPLGITQMGDGHVLVVDSDSGGQSWLLSDRLELVQEIPGFLTPGLQVSGVAFDPQAETVWFSVLQTGEVVEKRLEGGIFAATGRKVNLPFAPVGMAYSDELDAFFFTVFGKSLLVAADRSGSVLPGYPIDFSTNTNIPGISVSGGIFEVGRGDLFSGTEIAFSQLSQFGREFDGSMITTIDASLAAGANRVNGMQRSILAPDDILYLVFDPNESGEVLIGAIDPPDLQSEFISQIKADGAVWARGVAGGGSVPIGFRVAVDEGTSFSETVAFLTNNSQVRSVGILLQGDVTTSVKDGPVPAAEFELQQNYPNPFNPTTTISFTLPHEQKVLLEIFDVLGHKVETLLDNVTASAGQHKLEFDATGLSSGIYFVRIRAGAFSQNRRMILIR